MFCLDTDIIISIFRGDIELKKKISTIKQDDVAFTVITLCELFRGAYKSKDKDHNLLLIYDSLKNYKLLSLGIKGAEIFGADFNELEKEGKQTQLLDLLISSTSKQEDAILVTRNKKHFENIPDLKIEEW
jgi:tRNA(fMet)-specific endonuclease VapC